MDINDILKSFPSLIAVLGFGIVLVGAGYQGMQPNLILSELGVAIIFVDMPLWLCWILALNRKKSPKKEGYQKRQVNCVQSVHCFLIYCLKKLT